MTNADTETIRRYIALTDEARTGPSSSNAEDALIRLDAARKRAEQERDDADRRATALHATLAMTAGRLDERARPVCRLCDAPLAGPHAEACVVGLALAGKAPLSDAKRERDALREDRLATVEEAARDVREAYRRRVDASGGEHLLLYALDGLFAAFDAPAPPLSEAVRVLTEALDRVKALAADREAFVMQGPRVFVIAERIADEALTHPAVLAARGAPDKNNA